MKYCTKCGKECMDEAVICPNCGCAFASKPIEKEDKKRVTALQTAIKVLLVIGTIIQGVLLVPLLWCIPMTVSYCKKVDKGEHVGAGFAICTILFVSTLGGFLMLFDRS